MSTRLSVLAALSVVAILAEPELARASPGEADLGYVDRSGYHEEIVSNTVAGAVAGVALGFLVSEEKDRDSRAAIGGVAGAALGGALTAIFDRNGPVPSGPVIFRRSLWYWGIGNGLGISIAAGFDERPAAGLTLGLGTLGFVGAHLAAGAVDPLPGESDFLSSALVLGALVPIFIAFAASEDPSEELVAGVGLAGGNVAFLATVLLRPGPLVSRYRVFLLDVGAGAGGALGALVGFFVAPDSEQALFGGTAAGVVAGVITAWLLTDDLREPTLDDAASSGSLVTVRDGHLALGPPLPELRSSMDGTGRSFAQVRLFGGTW